MINTLKIFCLSSLFLFSCEKVIEVDLNDEEEKIVIEGIVVSGEEEHLVKISKTIKIGDTGTFPFVDNAQVTLWDSEGNNQVLTYFSEGVYKTVDFLGVEGRTYTLEVNWNGNTYTAHSTIPNQVKIDSLTLEEFGFGSDKYYYPVPRRMDTPNVKNYYLFKLYQNSERVEGIYLQDDQYSDGVEILQPIFGGEFKSEDTLSIEMNCIDNNVYKYFFALAQNGGGTGGSIPANPKNNFSGNCLGYFSAQTKEVKTLIIP
ncbi:MAG: DUF4249 domain-containing protein [Flavobacteriia bacterium]|nr:DUF4249 domain-containing protein [Flavobacteriia bacterium]